MSDSAICFDIKKTKTMWVEKTCCKMGSISISSLSLTRSMSDKTNHSKISNIRNTKWLFDIQMCVSCHFIEAYSGRIPGSSSKWSTWSGCSSTCGKGTQSRYRVCPNRSTVYSMSAKCEVHKDCYSQCPSKM